MDNTFNIPPTDPLAPLVEPQVRELWEEGCTHAAILGEWHEYTHDAHGIPLPAYVTEWRVHGVIPAPFDRATGGYLWTYQHITRWLEIYDATH